jgi:hypothetical protein
MTMMVRALVLDPSHGSRNSAGPICDLAKRDFSWSCEQISYEETQVADFKPVLSRLRRAFEECDVLIGLGNFFLFKWLGEPFGDEYIKLVQDRMRAGMPALFQLPRFFDLLQTGQIAGRTERIFRDCEVMSTARKVYSEKDFYPGPWGTSWFRKSDGCLLNPELFTGIDSLLLSGVNLLDYDGDTYPIAVAGPLHDFVDYGDEFPQGVLGKKDTVAVLRRTPKEFSIFLGGDAISATAETTLGETIGDGIQANRTFALRLLQALHDATQGHRYLNQAYPAFSQLERDLGQLIYIVLSRASGSDSIEKYFPEWVIDHIQAKGGKKYSRATYDDLVDIVLENWNLFQAVFIEISKGQVKKQLQRVNYKYRRHLAHPHKAEQEGFVFRETDVNEIRGVHTLVQQALTNVAT